MNPGQVKWVDLDKVGGFGCRVKEGMPAVQDAMNAVLSSIAAMCTCKGYLTERRGSTAAVRGDGAGLINTSLSPRCLSGSRPHISGMLLLELPVLGPLDLPSRWNP
jgi:hypothetical protein